jgi:hypothetical protein
MDATQECWYEADVHRVRGRLLIAVGDPWPKQALSRPSQLRAKAAFCTRARSRRATSRGGRSARHPQGTPATLVEPGPVELQPCKMGQIRLAACVNLWHDRPLTHMAWINWITINRPLAIPLVRLSSALRGSSRPTARRPCAGSTEGCGKWRPDVNGIGRR